MSDGDRVFVLVGDRDEPKPNAGASDFASSGVEAEYAVKHLALVALEANGGRAWSTELCPSRPVELAGPLVLDDGSVAAACAGTVYRVDGDGTLLASVAVAAPFNGTLALGEDGSVAALAHGYDAASASANWWLTVLSDDLSLRWSKPTGFTTHGDLLSYTAPSALAAPVVGADGSFQVVCDACDPNSGGFGSPAGFVSFSADSGNATASVPVGMVPSRFGTAAASSERRVFVANQTLFDVQGGDVSTRPTPGDSVLLAVDGPVALVGATEVPGLAIGGDIIHGDELDPASALASPRLLTQNQIVLSNGVVVDRRDLSVTRLPDFDPDNAPIVLGARVVYRSRPQLLRAVSIGADSAHDAPWPCMGGDERGTHRAR